MILSTKRMVLRPWRENDAESLYEYACDPRVGIIAGWPPHKSVEESREIINTVFNLPNVWALTLKDEDKAIGCIGISSSEYANFPIAFDEGEVGYWIGVPFWGKGLVPEALREVIRYAFEDLRLNALWCGYFDGNEQSKRVGDKCGFCYHHTDQDKLIDLTGEIRTEHITRLTRKDWALAYPSIK